MFVFTVGDGVAVGLVAAADDSAAELVQLGETKSFGVQNGDNGCVWDVHTNFHNSCADEDINITIIKLFHHFLFFVWFHFAVQDVDGEVGKYVCRKVFVFFFY